MLAQQSSTWACPSSAPACSLSKMYRSVYILSLKDTEVGESGMSVQVIRMRTRGGGIKKGIVDFNLTQKLPPAFEVHSKIWPNNLLRDTVLFSL